MPGKKDNDQTLYDDRLDANGNKCVAITAKTVANAGEDVTADVQKVEQRFAYSVPQVASGVIKSSAGFLHALIISCNDAAPTAGTIDVYDNTSATGNKIFSWTLTATAFTPVSLVFDVWFNVGLYVAITTTADVNVSASYR